MCKCIVSKIHSKNKVVTINADAILRVDSISFALVYHKSYGYSARCEFKLRMKNARERVAYAIYMHLHASTYTADARNLF